MNWETLKGVVADAMELPAPERSGFLDRACAEDSELRREAEALLSADMPGFLNLDAPPLTPNAPDRVGNYRLESQLGEGGMGVVYTGVRDDGNFEQRVAIKLIKLGMDSGAILRRFVAERRILARLVHPNITRILDGGAASDGRPYFVMELIDGVPIDQYCRDLDVSRTIEIFLPSGPPSRSDLSTRCRRLRNTRFGWAGRPTHSARRSRSNWMPAILSGTASSRANPGAARPQ